MNFQMPGSKSRRLACTALLAAAGWLIAGTPLGAGVQAPAAVADVVAAAEKYLAAYEHDTPALFAEERSQQTQNRINTKQEQRALRSNVLMFRDADGPVWIRDVIEVNGLKVVPEADRLLTMVTAPSYDPRTVLLQIVMKSATQQYGGAFRAINEPGCALGYLRAGRPAGVEFKSEGVKTVDGTKVVLLTVKDAPGGDAVPFAVSTVNGRFWIEPSSGRVVQTELEFIMLAVYRAKITVRYGLDKALGTDVPVSMIDEYENRGELVTGRADYRNFRKVTIDPAAFSIKR